MEITFWDITDDLPPPEFYYDSFLEGARILFVQLQNECGKCIKGVYFPENRKIGWIFQKRTHGLIQQTWVIIIDHKEYRVMREYKDAF